MRQHAFKVVSMFNFIHCFVVSHCKLQLSLACDVHWCVVMKPFHLLPLDIMRHETFLAQYFPVYLQKARKCFTGEDYLCEAVNYGFIEAFLLGYPCNAVEGTVWKTGAERKLTVFFSSTVSTAKDWRYYCSCCFWKSPLSVGVPVKGTLVFTGWWTKIGGSKKLSSSPSSLSVGWIDICLNWTYKRMRVDLKASR